jgi:radical SAM superfamily enzyme YgiQ (UPF0313 family)
LRVLLVQPPQFGKPGFNKIALVEPLGLEMVAGALLPDHEVKIHDMRIDDSFEKALSSFRPDAVGISCSFTIDVYRARKIAETSRAAGIPFIFVGGLHASLNPPDFDTPDIDCIVVGDGEFTSHDLIATVARQGDISEVQSIVINAEGGQKFTGPRPQADLDTLPFPARELLPASRKHRYYFNFWKPLAAVETARGCPHRCNFCSVWSFFEGRCRTKSPERVADELERRKETYILITDDNFLLNVKRARKIGEVIAARGINKRYSFQARSDTIVKHPELLAQWRKIGLSHIFIGFESLDQEELQATNKKNDVETNEAALRIAHSHDLTVTGAFIVNPDYGPREFKRLREYIASRRITLPQFTVLTPLPGTDLFREIEKKISVKNYELYDFLHSVLPTKLDPKDFYREFAGLYKSAYSNVNIFRNRLFPLIGAVATRRLSLTHMRRIIKAAGEFADGKNYLSKPARDSGNIS